MRLVARAPVPVHRKLLVGFGVVVALLVTFGAIGVHVLGQSNDRAESLRVLHRSDLHNPWRTVSLSLNVAAALQHIQSGQPRKDEQGGERGAARRASSTVRPSRS